MRPTCLIIDIACCNCSKATVTIEVHIFERRMKENKFTYAQLVGYVGAGFHSWKVAIRGTVELL
jgi:hypothetical protein